MLTLLKNLYRRLCERIESAAEAMEREAEGVARAAEGAEREMR